MDMPMEPAAFLSPIPLNRNKRIPPYPFSSYSSRRDVQLAPCCRRLCVATASGSESTTSRVPLVVPSPATTPNICWEIDFYSRPVLDERGKKVWELIIVDDHASFQHIARVPNAAVNSRELRQRVQDVIESVDPSKRPQCVRFFRAEMSNMIRIAIESLGITVKPSRRCHTLIKLVKHRENDIYPKMKGFDEELARTTRTRLLAGVGPGVGRSTLSSIAEKMPDSMRGEKFLFTDFSLGEIRAFFRESDLRDYFGEKCYVESDMQDDFRIPGLCVLSERAKGVAAWTSGSEIVYIKGRMETKNVTFECGIRTSYMLAKIKDSLKDDVKKFEEAKTYSNGLHFLTIQDKKNPELVEGFWLLRDVEML